MQLGSKTPKSELYEFFQLQPGMRQPTFDTQPQSNPPAVPDYLCKLTCPGIDTQGLPEKTFTGQARNKKTAEQNAAEQALNFLRQRDLMAPAMSHKPEQQMPHDLQEQLASIKMAPLHDLQRKAMNQGLAPKVAPSLQTADTTNGLTEAASSGTAHGDYDSMQKDELVAKLKQALSRIQRLEEEVEWEKALRQQVIPVLSEAKQLLQGARGPSPQNPHETPRPTLTPAAETD
ncbi:hypothetical protein ABBQ38_013637 [Trebouxia sp. C0009 RCD-2024]